MPGHNHVLKGTSRRIISHGGLSVLTPLIEMGQEGIRAVRRRGADCIMRKQCAVSPHYMLSFAMV